MNYSQENFYEVKNASFLETARIIHEQQPNRLRISEKKFRSGVELIAEKCLKKPPMTDI